jgi:DNA mismatch repair protein MutS2
LKLLGLVALMARNGIPVPADPRSPDHFPRVDYFHPVLADIGDLQSVGGDLSTFSGHILVCKQVLENSGKNALVLMDELGSGTDPNQGVAIAQAILEALLETGARVAITTHYLELKQLAASDERFAVAGMQFVNGRPTYKLLPGTVGESYALAVAERLELPRSVIDRANELLDSETRQMGDLIRELEDQKALAYQQVEDLARKQSELVALEQELKAQQAKLEQKQLIARREEAKKFAAKLEEKERVLEEILEKLKSDPSRKIIAKSWDDIKFVKRDALNEAEYVPSVIARKMEAAAAVELAGSELVPLDELRDRPELNVGDTLIVCKKGALFGRSGTIAQVSGSQLEVKVMGMIVRFKLSEVALPNGGTWSESSTTSIKASGKPKSISKATEKALQVEEVSIRRNGDWQQQAKASPANVQSRSPAMRTESNTVDVRGCSLEEAKEQARDMFSTSLMSRRPVVYILHGHGSGVLKTKIRAWLKSERHLVKSFEPADPSDGGDAFTRVELR